MLAAAEAKTNKKKKDPELFKKEKVDYGAILDKQIPPNEALAKVSKTTFNNQGAEPTYDPSP